MNDEEKAALREASEARDAAHAALVHARGRSGEIEDIVTWLRRARAKNNFSERVALMIEQGRR